ncbi:hypothetical protein AUP68_09224 [Ilyonectria robusta]
MAIAHTPSSSSPASPRVPPTSPAPTKPTLMTNSSSPPRAASPLTLPPKPSLSQALLPPPRRLPSGMQGTDPLEGDGVIVPDAEWKATPETIESVPGTMVPRRPLLPQLLLLLA